MDRLRSGFHRKPRKESPSRPTIVTDTTVIRSRNTTPEPGTQPSLQVPAVPMKKASSPVFRTLRDLSRSHKRARSPATGSDTTSPQSAMSARDSPSDRFRTSPHPLSAVSPNDPSPITDPFSELQNAHQPKMPSFLTLPPHEIDARFQEITWLERNRTLASATSPSPDFRWAPLTGEHRKLDRYVNIQPWENNRVRLCVPVGKQDYINASPVTLRSVSPAARGKDSLEAGTTTDRYIAMQGPKHKTTDHTWRMIIEQLDSPAVIVMLTETHEGDHEKCYPYFPRRPEDAPLEIGLKDEFSDGFRASVRCEGFEETEAGNAIELRKLVVTVYKDLKSKTTTKRAETIPFSVDDNSDVKMLSPAKTSYGEEDNAAPVFHDDIANVTAQTGRASTDPSDSTDTDAAAAQQLTPQDDAQSLQSSQPEHEYEERIVWHFLYKKWPDFGVPALEDIESFFTLMRLSREKNAQHPGNPRIVHCSAGVGRSGTFIALEHLMREMDAGVLEDWDARLVQHVRKKVAMGGDGDAASIEGHNGHVDTGADRHVDEEPAFFEAAGAWPVEQAEDEDIALHDLIFHTVNQLREQRRHMVQAEPQYQFLYQVLRKLWEEKYGNGNPNNATTKAVSSSAPTPVGEHPQQQRASPMDGEPAAKRLEFDPFIEE